MKDWICDCISASLFVVIFLMLTLFAGCLVWDIEHLQGQLKPNPSHPIPAEVQP